MAKKQVIPENELRELGLTRETGEIMFDVLRRAGYNTGDEAQRLTGLVALASATRVHEAATRAEARSRGRTGRNDPCPCGSGRKFKKCCQAKVGPSGGDVPVDVPSPLDSPDLIPRLHQPEHFSEDMERLDQIFREDPVLRRVRFDGPRVFQFVAEQVGEEPEPDAPAAESAPDEDAEDRLDRWVTRYLREEEGEEVLGRLADALVAAAPRWARNTADLRALALGVALAEVPEGEADGEEAAPEDANPLHGLIFRCTLQEQLEAHKEIDRLVEEAGGWDSVRAKVAAGDLDGVPEAIREVVEEDRANLGAEIREGLLPVGMPFPSLLPCLVRLAVSGSDPDPSGEALLDIVTASAEELGLEDAVLLDGMLEDWLAESQEGAEPETLERIAMLRSELAAGSSGPLGFDLIAAALYHRRVVGLVGEPEPAIEGPSGTTDAFTPEYLERYGDFLWAEGLPDTARRTWRLCELYGALSPGLLEKLSRETP